MVWDKIPESMSGFGDAGERIGLAVIDALADLHEVDPAAVGLSDLGRPEGYLPAAARGMAKALGRCGGRSRVPGHCSARP